MRKLGIVLEHLGTNDTAFWAIRALNSLPEDMDGIAFYEILARPNTPCRFGVMTLAEAFDFDGVLIATNLRQMRQILRFPSPTRKIFYPWNLEWLLEKKRMNEWQDILDIDIIARSNDYAKMLMKFGLNVIDIIPDFQSDRLVELSNG